MILTGFGVDSPGVYCAAFNLTELAVHTVEVSYNGSISPIVGMVFFFLGGGCLDARL